MDKINSLPTVGENPRVSKVIKALDRVKKGKHIQKTILYRNSFDGGDGWTVYPMEVIISENCTSCGEKRGESYKNCIPEHGDFHYVDTWKNDCGHVDKYEDLYFEHLENMKAGDDINNQHSRLDDDKLECHCGTRFESYEGMNRKDPTCKNHKS